MLTRGSHAWIDASAGVAGDMLLGALLDAGASRDAVQAALDAVVPGSVILTCSEVTRAGMRATKVDVEVTGADQPHRSWPAIRHLLDSARLPADVGDRAATVFARLAAAEAAVHGTTAEEVHFHEVGALDSIADVVGTCAALDDLGVVTVSAGPVAVGSGRTRISHGEIGVPVPAVVELATGWRVVSGGAGELATPTGMALVVTLGERCEDLPELTVSASGAGAGTRDTPGRANVTRVVLGEPHPTADDDRLEAAVLLEANVDDLDPRLWPIALEALLANGASDAWLSPILMKKGRPAHTLSVLCPPDRVPSLREVIIAETPTFGVRQHVVGKYALPRGWVEVQVFGERIAVKVAHRDGTIVRATPEIDDVAGAAARLGRPATAVLAEAIRRASEAGLAAGNPRPPQLPRGAG